MIPLCIPEIKGNEWKYIKECLDTNWVSSSGKYVDLFEERFKNYIESSQAVVTMNGTSAIHLALRVLGIGEGDEVIVPSMTFIASVNPILYVGAEPVFVDVCKDTYVMDISKVESLITEKTKAIIPVHLYGNMVDMEPLIELAEKYNLYIIEDATEGLGSEYKMNDGIWKKAGTIGHIGCFSFNGNKLITTGGGGMLVTDNIDLGRKAKSLSTQAKVVEDNNAFFHDDIGYNFRMPNILAAMGLAQLENIEEYISAKKEHARVYDEMLKNIEGISLSKELKNEKRCFWLYALVIEDDFGKSRDELILEMKKNYIETRPFFQPIHKMKPYKDFRCGNLCVTEELALKGINLPSSVGLKKQEIYKVCQVIQNI
ncbi:LegC family aminotransferase [Crassaminicella thermophila]|uniref:LegC family aminotransferase n=1 Tax=Crassaminicella thermophila TaxID=2599308 RepID=A0A5C0SAW7_CRATE|nr:LegC family aminotransferase [Crassaminicella thermophila]QEK11321.1 LegC family aminotransferase [Crassaminicella thermophila]